LRGEQEDQAKARAGAGPYRVEQDRFKQGRFEQEHRR
jgi:hypothetical protein